MTDMFEVDDEAIRNLVILAKEGWGAHYAPEVGWEVRRGWPYYLMGERRAGAGGTWSG